MRANRCCLHENSTETTREGQKIKFIGNNLLSHEVYQSLKKRFKNVHITHLVILQVLNLLPRTRREYLGWEYPDRKNDESQNRFKKVKSVTKTVYKVTVSMERLM